MTDHQPLLTILVTVIAGVFSLILASKARLPSILYFLGCGIFLGPQFLNIIQPSVFRSNFPQYISISVALILFEGGMSLKIPQLKEISRALKGLLTLGVVTTLILVAVCTNALTDLSWKRSILFGAVMIVTGPTVVIPILQRIRIKEYLHNILKWEAILIDPLGVIIAVVLFELLVSHGVGVVQGMTFFVARFIVGTLLGLLCGWVMVTGLTKKNLLQFEGEELGGLFVLATVLLFYGASELILPESGLVAATVAGFYFGNKKFALKDKIVHFKEQITLFALSGLFILLSANVPVRKIQSVYFEGIILLALMIFVIRPLAVFISTYKDEKLSIRDKVFLSFMAPRGIVSASLASLFALQFEERALSGRGVFLPLAFSVIVGSILFYALFSGVIAKLLQVREEKGRGIAIVGANALGLLLAEELRKLNFPIKIIDMSPVLCQRARGLGFEAFCGSGFDKEFLEDIDLKGIVKLIAVTPNHAVNLLCCQAFSSYLSKKNVFRLWDMKESWESVAAVSFDESRGKPLWLRLGAGAQDKLQDWIEDKCYALRTEKKTQALKLTPEVYKEFKDTVPLFAVVGQELFLLYPGANLPAGSEIRVLSYQAKLPVPS